MPDSGNADAPLREQRGAENNAGKGKPQGDDNSLVARWHLLGAATRDRRLSRADCAALWAVAERINRETGMTWGRFETFAKDAALSRRQWARSILRLHKTGWLDVVAGRGGKANQYRLNANLGTELGDSLGTKRSANVGTRGATDLALSAVPTSSPLPASSLPTSEVPTSKVTVGVLKKRAPRRVEQTFREWVKQVHASGETCIPPADPIHDWAEKAGIPVDYLYLAWRAFEDKHTDSGKRYADWRAAFRNAVKGNWMKVWYFEEAGGCRLTTVGIQFQRVVEADESKEATHGVAR